MSKTVKPASFETFLEAPARLSERSGVHVDDSNREVPSPAAAPSSARGASHLEPHSRKVKVGLTIDENLVDAVDDYIYYARKQGRRLKKNDVYEAALRQFLETQRGDAL